MLQKGLDDCELGNSAWILSVAHFLAEWKALHGEYWDCGSRIWQARTRCRTGAGMTVLGWMTRCMAKVLAAISLFFPYQLALQVLHFSVPDLLCKKCWWATILVQADLYGRMEALMMENGGRTRPMGQVFTVPRSNPQSWLLVAVIGNVVHCWSESETLNWECSRHLAHCRKCLGFLYFTCWNQNLQEKVPKMMDPAMKENGPKARNMEEVCALTPLIARGKPAQLLKQSKLWQHGLLWRSAKWCQIARIKGNEVVWKLADPTQEWRTKSLLPLVVIHLWSTGGSSNIIHHITYALCCQPCSLWAIQDLSLDKTPVNLSPVPTLYSPAIRKSDTSGNSSNIIHHIHGLWLVSDFWIAGEYRQGTGERFTGVFVKGQVLAGSKGAWADSKGHRYPVTIQRTVPAWEIRDDGRVFTLREKVLPNCLPLSEEFEFWAWMMIGSGSAFCKDGA